jgi:HK97 family phage major capsid protein
MDTELPPESEALAASFDIVARQDEADQAIGMLRSDVDEVKARLERVGRAAARPALETAATSPEVKGFVDLYLRQGKEIELKALSGATPADGGYAVPHEIDALIARELKEISPIRGLAQVVQVGTAGYRKLIAVGGTASGWVGETAGRPETDTPDFQEIVPPSGDLYANPAASQRMLDDAAFDVEGWLAARSRWSSRGPKAPRSSAAAAPTSRRASSPRPSRSTATARARSGRCSMSRAATTAGSTRSPRSS